MSKIGDIPPIPDPGKRFRIPSSEVRALPDIEDLLDALTKLEAEHPREMPHVAATLDPGALGRFAASTRREIIEVLVKPLELHSLLAPAAPAAPEPDAVLHLADGLRRAFDGDELSTAPRPSALRTAAPYGQKPPAPAVLVEDRKGPVDSFVRVFDAYAPERAPAPPRLDATTVPAPKTPTEPMLRFFLSAEGQSELARRAWTPAATDSTPVGRGRARRGWEQAIGCVLVDLVDGVLDEATALSERRRRARSAESICADLGRRVQAVGARVVRRWRPALDAFVDGGLAALVATVLSAVVDAFVRTSRRAVRLLRDGTLSLRRALRVLAAAPRGVEGAQEASKLVLGLVATGGVSVEASVESALAPLCVAAITSTVAGLVAIVLVGLLDRFDLFGAIARPRGDQRRAMLRARAQQMLDELLGHQVLG